MKIKGIMKEIKTQTRTNEKTSLVHRLELLFSKCPYYPKQFVDSTQFLSKHLNILHRIRKKLPKFIWKHKRS